MFVGNDRGLRGFWIGDPSAKYVIIHFHGMAPVNPNTM